MQIGRGQGGLVYQYRLDGGMIELDAEHVFHVRGMGVDGVKGYSLISDDAYVDQELARASAAYALVGAGKATGEVFYPWPGHCDSPRGAHPQHLRGVWLTRQAWPAFTQQQGGRWLLLPRSAWLAPARASQAECWSLIELNQWLTQLDPQATPEQTGRLLRPPPDDLLEAVAIGNAVNKVANDTAEIQLPLAELPHQEAPEEPKRHARKATRPPADDGQGSLF